MLFVPLSQPHLLHKKKYDDWHMTVYSMKNHYGVLIAEGEVEVIALYINETYGK
jgi:hypothetical protein